MEEEEVTCALCGGEVVEKLGELPFKSKKVGRLLVPGIRFEECLGCGDRLLLPEECDKVTEYVREKEKGV